MGGGGSEGGERGGGNPTQSHMFKGGNPPRHTLIWAHHIGNSQFTSTGHVQVKLTEVTDNTSSLGWDTVDYVVDITGDGNTWDAQSSAIGIINLDYYGTLNNGAIQSTAHWRVYKVHYFSGHEEKFVVLIPGYYQSIGYLYNIYALTFSSDCNTQPCLNPNSTPLPHFQFHGGPNWYHSTFTSQTMYQFTQINIDSDPSNIWSNGASLSTTAAQSPLNNYCNLQLYGRGGSQDNFTLANINGGGTATTFNPAEGQAASQKIEAIVAIIDVDNNDNTLVNNFTNTNWAGGANIPWQELTAGFTTNYINNFGVANFPFAFYIDYSENLPLCDEARLVVEGCDDPNNMAYWVHTGVDCNGDAIPANIQLTPSLATWTGECCPDCIHPNGDGVTLSTNPLILNVQSTGPTTIGGTDGYIDVTIVDQGFDATGIPAGLPTGVGNYTFVLQNQDQNDTMCGNTAGLGVGSGSIANNSFTFGNTVLGTNINNGLLQNSGSVASATISAAGTGYTGATSVATTGGTGTGLTVNTTASGTVTGIAINAAGSGYLVGDVITITGGGANATITVTTGSATYAASAIQGYVPGGTSGTAPFGLGTANTEGLRAGCYDVYVFDSSATICLGTLEICCNDPSPIAGCTDNNPGTNGGVALNFDPLATIANNNNCHYCEASTGNLIDGNTPSQISPDISTGISLLDYSSGGGQYPSNTTTSDAYVTISGLSATAAFQNYINDVIDASNIQNADYMVALYKWDVQSTAGSFAASTIVNNGGTPINNQGQGWNVALHTSTLGGAGLTYGYYSIKIWISDPDAVVEIEECYEIIDFIIPVPACVDVNGVATDALGNIVSDPNLYFHDPALCLNNLCCDIVSLTPHGDNDGCTIQYQGQINCFQVTQYHEVILQYYDNGNWVDVVTNTYGTQSTGGVIPVFTPNWSTGFIWNNITFAAYGSGDYRIQWTSLITGQSLCTLYSNIETITLGIWGCMDATLDGQGNHAINYNPLATCSEPCIWCVYGCTDQLAQNYNSLATCDDGSCTYCNTYGCTDPTACNYDSEACRDDGSCTYNCCGCTNILALNYGYNAAGVFVGTPPTCDDGSCMYCEDPPMTYTYTTTAATTITTPSGNGFFCEGNDDGCIHLTVSSTTCLTGTWTLLTCTFYCGISQSDVHMVPATDYAYDTQIDICNLPFNAYTLTLVDCNGCELVINITVPSEGALCGCTDPNAINYEPTAVYDDGTCEYCGCTDENAINYNPGATQNCIPDTCIYPSLTAPCIPTGIDQTIRRLEVCISENGFDYYNKLVTGQSDDCSIMNVWKLILMAYLLKKKGLDCIYNCADANTPDASDVYITCWRLWSTGGPSTGLNDPVQTAINLANGTKQGTHSTVTMFTTGSLYPGDVIKHHISKNIWIFYGPGQSGVPTPVSVAGLDPENASGNLSGYWGFCNDSMRYISNENNINYIDNFINFANTFCRDCDNDPKGLFGSASNLPIPIIQHGIDGIDGIDI